MTRQTITRSEFVQKAKGLEQRMLNGPLHPVARHNKDLVLRRLAIMIGEIEHGHLPPLSERHAILAYVVADQWPLGDELGNAIVELEGIYRKLE